MKRLHELRQMKADYQRAQTTRPNPETAPPVRPLVQNNRSRVLPAERQKALNAELEALPPALDNGFIGGIESGAYQGLGGNYLNAASDFVGRGIANVFRPDEADKPNNFRDHLEAHRQRADYHNRDAGAGDDIGRVVGMMMGLGKLQGAGLTASRFIPQGLTGGKAALATTGAAAADGAALGGIDALLSGGDVRKTMTRDGLTTAAADAVLRGSGKALSRMADPIRRMELPTAAQLKATAGRAYDALEGRGEPLGDGLNTLLAKVRSQLDAPDVALDRRLQPATSRMVRDLEALSPQDRIAELMSIRKRAKRVSGSKGEDNHAAKLLRKQLDSFLEERQPQAFAALRQADQTYARGKSAEAIDNAIESARQSSMFSGSGGNVNNNVRRALNRVATGKQARFLPQETRQQIERVAKGSPLNNAGRQIGGALDPTSSKLNLGMQVLGATTGGVATGGASLAFQAPLAAVGIGSRLAADHGTISAARDISRRIRAMGLDIPESQLQRMLADPREAGLLARVLGQSAAPASPAIDRTDYLRSKQEAAARLAANTP